MGLLARALQVRNIQNEKERAGLLARAIVYTRSMERAGLLERAKQYREKKEDVEAVAEEAGLLEKAAAVRGTYTTGVMEKEEAVEIEEEEPEEGLLKKALYFSEGGGAPGEGLLAKALRFYAEFESERAKALGVGLLAKASMIAESAVAIKKEEEKRPGLLERAVALSEEQAEGIAVQPQGEIETGVTYEEIPEAAEEVSFVESEAVIPEHEEAIEEEKAAELGAAGGAEAVELPEQVEKKEVKEAEIPPSFPLLFKQYLSENDTLSLMNLFSHIVAEQGYDIFLENLLETFVGLGKGKTGILFTFHKNRYRAEYVWERGGKPGRKLEKAEKYGFQAMKKISFKRTSKFTRALAEKSGSIVRRNGIKEDAVQKETAALESLEPWSIIPVVIGSSLAGFVLIGNQQKRPRIEKDSLLLFARFSALYIYAYVMEKNLQESVEKLLSKKNELLSFLELYNYAGISEISLSEIFRNAAENFEIEAAVIVGGWEKKGPLSVYAGFGLSENGLSRYKLSKTDNEIKSIIKEGAPAVPHDAEKRIDKFLQEDKKKVNTFIVVPVVFKKQTLAVLIIHRMRGVTKKVSSRTQEILTHIAQSLVPFLLYHQMSELEPFEVFESLLKREAEKARKSRSILYIIVYRIKNYKAVIKSRGFTQYRQLLDKFSSLIKAKIGKEGIAHIVSLNKVVLLFIHKDSKKASFLVEKVKSSVSELLNKEKAGIPLTFSPLRIRYPNDSSSVSEILQLIE